MATFRIHYEALEEPRSMAGERHTRDITAKNPDDARRQFKTIFEKAHKDCKPHIHKVKALRAETESA